MRRMTTILGTLRISIFICDNPNYIQRFCQKMSLQCGLIPALRTVTALTDKQHTIDFFDEQDFSVYSRFAQGQEYLSFMRDELSEGRWMNLAFPLALITYHNDELCVALQPTEAFFTDLQHYATSRLGVPGLREAIAKVTKALSEGHTN